MKQLIAALVACAFGMGAAFAQAPAAPTLDASVATPVHKKATPPAKHKKASVKKDRTKKVVSF